MGRTKACQSPRSEAFEIQGLPAKTLISEYARRFGVYDNLPSYLSYSLGAGETTVMRMVTAYSMFDNGGKRIIPTFIDRIQDRNGKTIWRHDERKCEGCNDANWRDQEEPLLTERENNEEEVRQLLELAQRGEILIQPLPIAGAKVPLHFLGLSGDGVEDALAQL